MVITESPNKKEPEVMAVSSGNGVDEARSFGRAKGGLRWLGALIAVGVLFYLFPLFHIVSLKSARELSAAAEFDAADFAATFWDTRLVPAAGDAITIEALIQAVNDDAMAAANKYGNRLGMADNCSFLTTGEGTIVTATDEMVVLRLPIPLPDSLSDRKAIEVQIDMGPLFGNAIRDGSRMLDINDFASSRDFNAISSELNRHVERTVFPQLRKQATPESRLRFFGAIELSLKQPNLHTLRLIPITTHSYHAN